VKEEYNRYREEVKNAMKEDVMGGKSQTTRHMAPSLDHSQQSQITGLWQIVPSGGRRRKLFSEVVKNQDNQRYRITLKLEEETITP
jgi:hypothetical protein